MVGLRGVQPYFFFQYLGGYFLYFITVSSAFATGTRRADDQETHSVEHGIPVAYSLLKIVTALVVY